MTNEANSTDKILDRLANEAEENLNRDVEGRRSAARALLDEMKLILTAAQQFDSAAYATSVESNGNLVVGNYVKVMVARQGNVVVAPVDVMGPKLPAPGLKYNASKKTWEHHLLLLHPVHAVLDVILPFLFAAIRRERGLPPGPPVPAGRAAGPVSPFRRPLPVDPRSWTPRT